MADLFVPENWWIWGLVLGFVLFFPVRRLIWMMAANRAARRQGGPVDEAALARLRRRSAVTAVLLCYLFALGYAYVAFGPEP